MARNGSGTFSLLNTLAPAGQVSNSTNINATMTDIATGLTDSINKDGTKAFAANQSLGGFKLTSMADGTARTDNIPLGQAQDAKANWVAAGGTVDVITATYSPVITTLVDGQECCFRSSGANTSTTPTFSPNSLTARTIVKNGGSALVAGDISAAGHEVRLRYLLASTRWELQNPAISSAAATTTEQLTGTSIAVRSTPDSVAALWEKGSDIASAGTITIGEGGYHHVTGTTTITDIDFATAKDGRPAALVFDGALILTHNATTLPLPGSANITTAAGDILLVWQDATDNVKTAFHKISGQPVVASSGARVLISTQTASASATLDFPVSSAYSRYEFELQNILPATDNVDMYIRVSIAGGYRSTASDYESISNATVAAPTTAMNPMINGTVSVGNTDFGVNGAVNLFGAGGTTQKKPFTWNLLWRRTAGNNFYQADGGGAFVFSNAALDGVRFLMSSGNITSGIIRQYGYLQ